MLATHVVPWTSAPRVASARTTRAERHGAWKRPGGTDGWCGGHEKARLYGRSVTRVSAPDARGGASMENHVQFLLSLTRRAALVATVSGLCLGPALASESEEEASPDQEPSTSDSIAEQPSVVAADSTSTPPSGSPLDDPWEGSYVKPALTVSQYVEEITANRAAAFGALRSLADSTKFSQLDNELVLAPFDDVKQACFYLPWALVKDDEEAGILCQRAWLLFRENLLSLDTVAIDASRYQADEDDVFRAIAALEKSLDGILTTVPARLK